MKDAVGIYKQGDVIVCESSDFHGHFVEGESYTIESFIDGKVWLRGPLGRRLHFPFDLWLYFPLPDESPFVDKIVICPVCWGAGTSHVHVYYGRGKGGEWKIKPCALCSGDGKMRSEDAFAWIHERTDQYRVKA